MAPQAFGKLSFRHGFLTFERRAGTSPVFFSCHYEPDFWRVNQIRNIQRPGPRSTARGSARSASGDGAGAVSSSTRTKSLNIGGIFSTMSKHDERTDHAGGTDSRRFRGWRIGAGKHEFAGKWGDRSNIVSTNKWKSVAEGGDGAIKRWIDKQMKDKACLIVLIGTETASRPWVLYEIEKAWEDGKGVFGIHIHNLKDNKGEQSPKGPDPLERILAAGVPLSAVTKTYDPPYTDSKRAYGYIQRNLSSWIAAAISARQH